MTDNNENLIAKEVELLIERAKETERSPQATFILR